MASLSRFVLAHSSDSLLDILFFSSFLSRSLVRKWIIDRSKPARTTTASLKYYIPYALVVDEKKKESNVCVCAHTYAIGKKKKRRPFARSFALLSRARDSFCQQAREHKWPCMYHEGMRDVVRKRKDWKGKRESESERSKKQRKHEQTIVSFRVFYLLLLILISIAKQKRNIYILKNRIFKFDSISLLESKDKIPLQTCSLFSLYIK